MTQQGGKWLMIAGISLFAIGLIAYLAGTKLRWLGNLPGDIRIERENFRMYIPITTMLLLSLLISAIIRLVQFLK